MKDKGKLKLGLKRILLAVYALDSLLLAFLLSWVFLASQNFWYGMWHDHAGIGSHIQEYGPQNRYIKGFAETTRAQRLAAFSQINRAVHNNGEGLRDITFTVNNGRPKPLLRLPEVVHLQDVAKLISFLKYCAVVAVLLWIILTCWCYKSRTQVLFRSQLKSISYVALVLTLAVLISGPENVFYQLHEWIFPKGHAWYFFYQDSLMSTMMKAPELFAWITMALLFWTIVFYLLIQGCLYRYIMPYYWGKHS